MDPVSLVLSLLLSVEIVAVFLSVAYIVRIHAPVKGQAPFLDRLVNGDIRVAFGGGAIGVVIVYSLLRFALPDYDLPPLVPPVGALLIGGGVMFLLWGPIRHALDFWRLRRSAPESEPGVPEQ